jgi:hypothetical protein
VTYLATTKIWAVHSRLDHLTDYVANKEKTGNREFELNTVLEYTNSDYKTEKKCYVTGINCNPETAGTSMMDSHKKSTKDLKVLAYHGYQSFAEGEVNAEIAHSIGVELAKNLWGDRFQVVVATHLNTNHFHNHFVLCSTSFIDGKRFHSCTESYMKMREESDALCKKYSLSVVKNAQRGKTKHYSEIKAEREGGNTWRGNIRKDIDNAILQSTTTNQFWKAMEDMGYELKMNVKYPGVKPPGHSRFFRLYKLGDDYTREAIKEKILKRNSRNLPFPEERKIRIKFRYYGRYKKTKKLTGLRALYIHYQYKLGILPKLRASNRRMHFLLREDLIKLDSIIAQCSLLCERKIDTYEQLASYKATVEEEMQSLFLKRKELRNQVKCLYRAGLEGNEGETMEVKAQISRISAKLKKLRKETMLCDGIYNRSAKMSQTLKQIESENKKEKGREKNKNEHIR